MIYSRPFYTWKKIRQKTEILRFFSVQQYIEKKHFTISLLSNNPVMSRTL